MTWFEFLLDILNDLMYHNLYDISELEIKLDCLLDELTGENKKGKTFSSPHELLYYQFSLLKFPIDWKGHEIKYNKKYREIDFNDDEFDNLVDKIKFMIDICKTISGVGRQIKLL